MIPKGVIPAMITPFTEQYTLHEPALRLMVRRFIDAGVHGLFGLGTNGEFFSLTFEEKVRIAEIIVEETKGSIPVYMGSGGIGTEEVIRLTREFERIGVDAVSVITPYFLTFTQQELLEHYKTIADSTSLPVVMYNIPSRTGNHLQTATVAELSKVPNIVGIKDSTGSYDNILAYLQATDPEQICRIGRNRFADPADFDGRGARGDRFHCERISRNCRFYIYALDTRAAGTGREGSAGAERSPRRLRPRHTAVGIEGGAELDRRTGGTAAQAGKGTAA